MSFFRKEALDNLHGILQYAYEYWKHNFENRYNGSFLENELMEHWVLYVSIPGGFTPLFRRLETIVPI